MFYQRDEEELGVDVTSVRNPKKNSRPRKTKPLPDSIGRSEVFRALDGAERRTGFYSTALARHILGMIGGGGGLKYEPVHILSLLLKLPVLKLICWNP